MWRSATSCTGTAISMARGGSTRRSTGAPVKKGSRQSFRCCCGGWSRRETWAGRWARAEQLAEQGCRAAEEAGSAAGVRPHARGPEPAARVPGPGRGRPARRRAVDARRSGTRHARRPPDGRARARRGCSSYGDAASVHEQLGPFVQPADWSEGLEPALWRFLPDEIEALVRLGQLDRGTGCPRALRMVVGRAGPRPGDGWRGPLPRAAAGRAR